MQYEGESEREPTRSGERHDRHHRKRQVVPTFEEQMQREGEKEPIHRLCVRDLQGHDQHEKEYEHRIGRQRGPGVLGDVTVRGQEKRRRIAVHRDDVVPGVVPLLGEGDMQRMRARPGLTACVPAKYSSRLAVITRDSAQTTATFTHQRVQRYRTRSIRAVRIGAARATPEVPVHTP